ncbi:butyrophilin-like protein 2 [Gadus chalcogrammus]|uniref:butyrophilin-like protein 2 n=1 Tax=Gadus chalcogrammus TaxID=1042646 RepID=UPI0024C4D0E6|nr:butyrophilin-like protein 2 [Gadus chalcogrammus]XP_056431834.1 butyrophilin-like protein 2 [Gadus chalcogrammus]XP_056431835.1 butyrophilin-like protein 2 [Gadus chalcogrammus]
MNLFRPLMEVLFLLLISFSAGEAHRALVGDDVTLSVDTKTSSDISKAVMEWSRSDLTPDIVHRGENGLTIYEDQNPAYRGRTMLSAEDLDRGIISLKLFHVRLADEGSYTCLFESKDNKYSVHLLVGAASSPVITLEDYSSSGLVLGCRAKGWYPQPKLSWWNADGHLLPAVTMTTTQDPDRLYNISSTLVVERKSPNRPLTCRVHQELFNQTRETEWHLPENLFENVDMTYRIAYALMTAAGVLLVVALVILAIACRIVRGNSQKQKDIMVMSCQNEDLRS